MAGVVHITASAGGPLNETGGADTEGITGSKPELVFCPAEVAGSEGNGGISGTADRGISVINGSATSCKERSGMAGISGVCGNGVLGNTADPSSDAGWSGKLTRGGTVLIGGSSGTETTDVAWAADATSVKVRAAVPAVAGRPSVLPLVIVPGVKGGGTFQSD